MENQFLLATDAAKLLNCSSQNVRLLERAGKLPALRTLSGVRLFAREDIDRLAAERRKRDLK